MDERILPRDLQKALDRLPADDPRRALLERVLRQLHTALRVNASKIFSPEGLDPSLSQHLRGTCREAYDHYAAALFSNDTLWDIVSSVSHNSSVVLADNSSDCVYQCDARPWCNHSKFFPYRRLAQRLGERQPGGRHRRPPSNTTEHEGGICELGDLAALADGLLTLDWTVEKLGDPVLCSTTVGLHNGKSIGGFDHMSRLDPRTCGAGFTCTSLYNLTTHGLCLPCRIGEWCPAGSISIFDTGMENQCPPGSICPIPVCRFGCPAGFLCSAGSFDIQNTATVINCENLSATADGAGVFCPEAKQFDLLQFTDKTALFESQLCSPGHYCPNSTTESVCQEGEYCWKGSKLGGSECPELMKWACPNGTAQEPMGIVAAVCLVASCSILWFLWLVLRRCRLHMARKVRRLAIDRGVEDVAHVLAGDLNLARSLSSQTRSPPSPAVQWQRHRQTAKLQTMLTPSIEADILRATFDAMVDMSGAVAAAGPWGKAVEAGVSRNNWMAYFADSLHCDDTIDDDYSLRGPVRIHCSRYACHICPQCWFCGRSGRGSVRGRRAREVMGEPFQYRARQGGGGGGRDDTYDDSSMSLSLVRPTVTRRRGAGDDVAATWSCARTTWDLLPKEINGNVSLARTEMPFRGFSRIAANDRIAIDFASLGLRLKSSHRFVLKGVSGRIADSSMVAVMGPSGAGKTSFMNALAGRAHYANRTGRLRINGHLGVDAKALGGHVGFVPQDDTVNDTLTVYENLYFSAKLRLPCSYSSAQRRNIIEDVLEVLDIGQIRDSIVGSVERRGISGGQRKRVNIGLELVADPTLLFLDEPTSGLDATSSQVVLRALQQLTRLGRTVVSVVHQPRFSTFKMFDQVILLGVGGQTVYSGDAKKARQYFSSMGFDCPDGENAADFFLDVIAGEVQPETTSESRSSFVPSDLFEMWGSVDPERWMYGGGADFAEQGLARSEGKEKTEPLPQRPAAAAALQNKICAAHSTSRSAAAIGPMPSSRSTTGWTAQFMTCAEQYVASITKDFAAALKNTAIVIGAALMGGLYSHTSSWDAAVYDSMPLKCTMMATLVGIAVGLSSISTFGKNRPMMLRELSSGISPSAYFLAHNVVDTVVLAFMTFVATSIMLTASGNPERTIVPILGVLAGVGWVCSGIAYVVTLTFDTANSVVISGLAIIVLGAILNGVQPHYGTLFGPSGEPSFMTVASDMAWGRYATPALLAGLALATANPTYFGGPTMRALGFLTPGINNTSWLLPNSFGATEVPCGTKVVPTGRVAETVAGPAAEAAQNACIAEALTKIQDQSVVMLFAMGLVIRAVGFLAIALVDRPKQNKRAVGELCRATCCRSQ